MEDKLRVFSLSNSGLDDTEIELAESVLLHARVLREFWVLPSGEVYTEAINNKVDNVIRNTNPASTSLSIMQYS